MPFLFIGELLFKALLGMAVSLGIKRLGFYANRKWRSRKRARIESTVEDCNDG
jgi:hypothetical protein